VRNHSEFLAYRLARSLARSLGPRAVARVGSTLGSVYLRIGSRRRHILDFNLGLAYPDKSVADRRRLARQVARHFGRVLLDALRIQKADPRRLAEQVTVDGQHNLDAALERAGDRGLFFLSAHLGSWEVAALVGGQLLPHGLAVINRPLDNPLLDAELQRLRSRFGNRVLGRDRIARDVLRAIAGGETVGILLDQRARAGEGVELPFLGHPSSSHPILGRFVARTLVPVVPIWGLWEGPGTYTVRFGEPLYADQLPAEQRDEVSLTRSYLEVTEAIIRERPEQWLWYHDRWRELRLRGGS
jgi:KDO2-lipid IV(A) lauroyltransferase